jgi:hypothetical protein
LRTCGKLTRTTLSCPRSMEKRDRRESPHTRRRTCARAQASILSSKSKMRRQLAIPRLTRRGTSYDKNNKRDQKLYRLLLGSKTLDACAQQGKPNMEIVVT